MTKLDIFKGSSTWMSAICFASTAIMIWPYINVTQSARSEGEVFSNLQRHQAATKAQEGPNTKSGVAFGTADFQEKSSVAKESADSFLNSQSSFADVGHHNYAAESVAMLSSQSQQKGKCDDKWSRYVSKTNTPRTYKGKKANFHSCCFQYEMRDGECKLASQDGTAEMCKCPTTGGPCDFDAVDDSNDNLPECKGEEQLYELKSTAPKSGESPNESETTSEQSAQADGGSSGGGNSGQSSEGSAKSDQSGGESSDESDKSDKKKSLAFAKYPQAILSLSILLGYVVA
eukprot:gnl/MRDRNA2_/MRDRNA2_146853_c0_seq1.p1 gnl/MRDRNA2_/MRDRNA2_146853_c0~~gnl/MRDRNA2_/MRDRNA2_146853_c0_seq1.p1  ORF type:complete len:288 (-),score=56.33 gnl/MRDRNA2_/MRDRNA2_146853_c0_seq1:83-946(-)